jgi:excinuclease ABC subunit A
MDKPDVDFIEGLSPAVSIDQKSTSRNPRSTGGDDHRGLRLPPAAVRPGRPAALPGLRRAGEPADPAADRRPGARARGGHPVPGARAGGPGPEGRVRELFRELQTKGYSRRRVDGATVSLAEPPKLDKKYKHSIDVVVDRLSA